MSQSMDLYWIWLALTAGIGNVKAARLVRHFHTPLSVYESDYDDYLKVKGISEQDARALCNKSTQGVLNVLEKCARQRISFITPDSPYYPSRLKEIFSPPCVLYYKGRFPLFDKSLCIGVVGTRNSTDYGLSVAEQICADLARAGTVIISGLAKGIDAAAHKGALIGGGFTAAVLGCGVDIIYPRENKELYNFIAQNGVILSEYPPGTPGIGTNFPVRNRIISGLSNGVFVVESAERGGALITASCAVEQGRDVFALPGNIYSEKSEGTNRLIQDGAKPVLSAADILNEYGYITENTSVEVYAGPGTEELKVASQKLTYTKKPEVPKYEKKPPVGLSEDEEKIYRYLSAQKAHVDKIAADLSMNSQRVSCAMTLLEINGYVRELPGRYFELT